MNLTSSASTQSEITLVVADDQPLMRRAIAGFFSGEPGFRVLAEAANGEEAIEATRSHRPDIVLMDLDMPRMNGIEATRLIAEENLESKVVVVSTFSVMEWVAPALRAGAAGYLLKESDPDELVAGVRDVMNDNFVLSPQVAALLIDAVVATPTATPPRAPEIPLTEREMEVVTLLAGGLSNKEMASELHLSEGSIKLHLGKASEKLHARDRLQLLVRAVELGLVNPTLKYPDTGFDRFK